MKGSLSLSVNAIVVFVLAFAMLGFGLLIINNLTGEVDPAIEGVFELNRFSQPPTSQNPIVISEKIIMKGTETKSFGIGVYNNKGSQIVGVPTIGTCTSGITNTQISIDGLSATIPPSESYGYKANIKTTSALVGNYICEISVGTTPNIVSAQFDIEIVS